jgi:predicted nucleotidyltransferase
MPYLIGTDEKRRAKLLEELKRIVALLPKYDVEKAYLIGSLAKGDISRTSDIDLVMVKETSEKFVNRMM